MANLSNQAIEKFKKFFHGNDELHEKAAYLACRWLDEKDYEDIREYQKVLEKLVPDYVTITKMTRRPFGFRFMIDGREFFYKVFADGRCTAGLVK